MNAVAGKAVLAITAVLLVTALGGVAYLAGIQGLWQPQAEVDTTTVSPAAGEPALQTGYSGDVEADMRRGRGNGQGGIEACAAIGDLRPGQAIRTLFNNHDKFEWSYTEYPEEWRIEWVITADSEDLAEILYYHVLQMECILERGGTPRAWDPVFVLESKLKPYIETEVVLDGNTVRVVKTAENECAWEVIRLHADVVKSFFENGWEEASKTHPIPEDVAEKCSEYLEDGG